jgi:perosamine synthetase
VPDLTFAAPANAVLYVGATPVLVDVDPNTMAMNMDAVEGVITERTRAIIPVHLYGHPADMGRVMTLAQKHDLLVIEDCAEAIGSQYNGSHVGNFGDAAIFSFFGNKTITTGEGGILFFKDGQMLERARMLRDHGMSRERRYWHDEVGFNYRMTNIQAAIGVAQVERVTDFVAQKRWIAEQYAKKLQSVLGLQLPGEFGDVVNSYWLYTAILPKELTSRRDDILASMMRNGIEARRIFNPLHRMPPYAPFVSTGQSYPVSNFMSESGISLPSGVTMNEADIEKVCLVLTNVLAQYRADDRLLN